MIARVMRRPGATALLRALVHAVDAWELDEVSDADTLDRFSDLAAHARRLLEGRARKDAP